jgi:hypothetical protein
MVSGKDNSSGRRLCSKAQQQRRLIMINGGPILRLRGSLSRRQYHRGSYCTRLVTWNGIHRMVFSTHILLSA